MFYKKYMNIKLMSISKNKLKAINYSKTLII